jgi:hypothetical protein
MQVPQGPWLRGTDEVATAQPGLAAVGLTAKQPQKMTTTGFELQTFTLLQLGLPPNNKQETTSGKTRVIATGLVGKTSVIDDCSVAVEL